DYRSSKYPTSQQVSLRPKAESSDCGELFRTGWSVNSDERERKPHPKHKLCSSAISPSITANSPSRPYPSPPGEKPTPPRLKEPCVLNKNALSLRTIPLPLKARSFKSPNNLLIASCQ